MLPFQCNNMHSEPLLGALRLGLYFLIFFLDEKRHWLSRQYALFGTLEVVFFLCIWHAFIVFQERGKTKKGVLPQTQQDVWRHKVAQELSA